MTNRCNKTAEATCRPAQSDFGACLSVGPTSPRLQPQRGHSGGPSPLGLELQPKLRWGCKVNRWGGSILSRQ